MSTEVDRSGRFRQRRRTRAAIVAAAAELLREGSTPSVNDVAQRADVSRRTVYQYFPTLEQLLLDATAGMLSEVAVDEAIAAADTGDGTGDGGTGPAGRAEAMVRALGELSVRTLPLGRSLIKLTIDQPDRPQDSAQQDGARAPRRGYRRVGWIEQALEPLRPRLDDAAFERLVSALAMVVGWEAMIVLQDLRGLGPDEQVDASVWAARALIRAALDD